MLFFIHVIVYAGTHMLVHVAIYGFQLLHSRMESA